MNVDIQVSFNLLSWNSLKNRSEGLPIMNLNEWNQVVSNGNSFPELQQTVMCKILSI
jgi:hypothetical protein